MSVKKSINLNFYNQTKSIPFDMRIFGELLRSIYTPSPAYIYNLYLRRFRAVLQSNVKDSLLGYHPQ